MKQSSCSLVLRVNRNWNLLDATGCASSPTSWAWRRLQNVREASTMWTCIPYISHVKLDATRPMQLRTTQMKSTTHMTVDTAKSCHRMGWIRPAFESRLTSRTMFGMSIQRVSCCLNMSNLCDNQIVSFLCNCTPLQSVVFPIYFFLGRKFLGALSHSFSIL